MFRYAQLMAVLAPGLALAGPCPVLEKFQPNAANEAPYRPLPVLAPERVASHGALSLSIHVRRFGGPNDARRTLRVGTYPVADVPVFEITPQSGTQAFVLDPDTQKPSPLSTECLQDSSWIFGGTQWQLSQGDQVRITLQSDLDYDKKSADAVLTLPDNGSVPCRATNLHTHGFLVPPTQPGNPTGLYGDYALDVTQPAGSLGGDKDDCGDPIMSHAGHRVLSTPMHYAITIPGEPHQNGLRTGEHPSGLFWYHPHPHGFSRMQTGGGTTGLITVGDLGDYACKEDAKGKPCPARNALAKVRYFELKDAQLSTAPNNGVYSLLADYSGGACGPRAPGEVRRGQCVFDDKKGIWVFTINGVQYPVIGDAKADADEVWRIANVSANASYLLQLQDAGNRSILKAFRLLAVDGVSVGKFLGDAPQESTRILLMPGSRAEVWITPEPGKSYVLNTAEIKTGAGDAGDDWPDIDLAEIRWPKPPFRIISRGPGAPLLPGVFVSGPREDDLGGAAGAAAGLLRGKTAPTPAPAVAPACRLDPGDERHIYMVKREDPREIFGVVAGIRRANGSLEFFDGTGQVAARSVVDIWKRIGAKDAPLPGPAFGSHPFANICTVQGRTETWVVENWTGECHNFHIHQTRFRLDTAREHAGNPNYFSYPKIKSDEPAVALMDSLIHDMTAAATSWHDAYHDSVPVPRGDGECHGDPGGAPCQAGRISLEVGFLRNEQVGGFIYHCHILEHEDGGMMGELKVCAKSDAACQSQAGGHH